MNQINLLGRLTAEPKLRYSATGKPVVEITLAVNRRFSDEADFIRVVFFQKAAETLANFCHKGSQLGVSGRLEISVFEQKYYTKVIGENFTFCGSRGDKPERLVPQIKVAEDVEALDIDDSELPF